jgi:hypothetical protein
VPDLAPLLGPTGVAIGAIALVTILGRLHLQEDERRERRITATEGRLEAALANTKAVTDVTDRAIAVAEGALAALRQRRD